MNELVRCGIVCLSVCLVGTCEKNPVPPVSNRIARTPNLTVQDARDSFPSLQLPIFPFFQTADRKFEDGETREGIPCSNEKKRDVVLGCSRATGWDGSG